MGKQSVVAYIFFSSLFLWYSDLYAGQSSLLIVQRYEDEEYDEEPESYDQRPRKRHHRERPSRRQKAGSKFYIQGDAFGANNAIDGAKKDAESSAKIISQDYTVEYVIEFESAGGIRLGFVTPQNQEFGFSSGSFEWGASLGFISGPNHTEKWQLSNGSVKLSSGTAKYTEEVQFIRGLVHMSNTISFRDPWVFRIGGGVGYAQGRADAEQESGAIFVTDYGVPAKATEQFTWSGFTWEAAASLVYEGQSLDIAGGVHFNGFPNRKETDDFSEMKWTPFGGFIALYF